MADTERTRRLDWADATAERALGAEKDYLEETADHVAHELRAAYERGCASASDEIARLKLALANANEAASAQEDFYAELAATLRRRADEAEADASRERDRAEADAWDRDQAFRQLQRATDDCDRARALERLRRCI